MEIKLMQLDDVNKVHALSQELLLESSWSYNSILDTLDDQHYNLVAVEGNQIVGFLLSSFYLDEAEILSIAVQKASQHKGYAKAMLNAAIDQFRHKGIYRVLLEVKNSNAAAINLYTSLGFNQISWRKNYYGNQPALILEKLI